VSHLCWLGADNAAELIARYDIVVDGSDNFATRFLINDACVFAGKPNVHGSVYRFEGQASVFDARRGPCYRCIFPAPPPPGAVPSCAEGGVLGVLPGIIGLIQATETIKLIIGAGEPLIGRLLVFDALEMRFRNLKLAKNEACPVCGTTPSITTLRDEEQVCEAPAASRHDDQASISPAMLHTLLDRKEPIELLDVREPLEREIAKLANTKEIPLGELTQRLNELDRSKEIVVYCRTGGRSARAVDLLREAGFAHARNLTGGLHAWIDDVDPSLTRY
jgi:adenylyltransferase/sulfurtransferase